MVRGFRLKGTLAADGNGRPMVRGSILKESLAAMGGRWFGLAKERLAADGCTGVRGLAQGIASQWAADGSGSILKETLAMRWGFRLKGRNIFFCGVI